MIEKDTREWHRTLRGELVRSKSEMRIANCLYERGIDYEYEKPLHLCNGRCIYPDFTIRDRLGLTFYWEHLFPLNDQRYREHWRRTRCRYLAAGIWPFEDGGGPNGALIETRDTEGLKEVADYLVTYVLS